MTKRPTSFWKPSQGPHDASRKVRKFTTYKYVFSGSGLAARDILDQHGKFRELDERTRRIEAIEERLASSQQNSPV
jgi:hypothetical protein